MGLLEGKVGLVTGAGSGIGRVTARIFAREGARVVAADWNQETAAQTAAEIESEGFEALAVHADVSDEASVEAMIGATLDRFGTLDCASNNAALGAGFHPTHELDRARPGAALEILRKRMENHNPGSARAKDVAAECIKVYCYIFSNSKLERIF